MSGLRLASRSSTETHVIAMAMPISEPISQVIECAPGGKQPDCCTSARRVISLRQDVTTPPLLWSGWAIRPYARVNASCGIEARPRFRRKEGRRAGINSRGIPLRPGSEAQRRCGSLPRRHTIDSIKQFTKAKVARTIMVSWSRAGI